MFRSNFENGSLTTQQKKKYEGLKKGGRRAVVNRCLGNKFVNGTTRDTEENVSLESFRMGYENNYEKGTQSWTFFGKCYVAECLNFDPFFPQNKCFIQKQFGFY